MELSDLEFERPFDSVSCDELVENGRAVQRVCEEAHPHFRLAQLEFRIRHREQAPPLVEKPPVRRERGREGEIVEVRGLLHQQVLVTSDRREFSSLPQEGFLLDPGFEDTV